MSIIDLLFGIENRRELYIGDGDLFALQHFVSGYCVCLVSNGIDHDDSLLRSFDNFVHEYYAESSTCSLFQCIVDHTTSKDSAFTQFFTLLHSYTNKQAPQ